MASGVAASALRKPNGSHSVALVNASTIQWGDVSKIEPVGLTYLAGALEAAGYDAAIFDFEILLEHYTLRELARAVSAYPVVGVTYYSTSLPSRYSAGPRSRTVDALSLIHELKRSNPSTIVVVGGPGATSSAEWLLATCPDIDYVLSGEAEDSLPRLLTVAVAGRSLGSVPGLSFRRGGRVVRTNPAPPRRDLDGLPAPSRESLQFAHRYRPTILSSRGCPHRCAFCQSETPSPWRSRAAKNVVDEIESIHRMTGQSYFEFADPNFTASPSRARAIAEGIMERGLHILFSVTSTTKTLSRDIDLAADLRSAGCCSINLGVESFVQTRLDRWRTGKRVDEHVYVLERLRSEGMGLTVSLLPFDDETTVEDLAVELYWVNRLDIVDLVDDFANRLVLFPGTILNTDPTKKEWKFRHRQTSAVYRELRKSWSLQGRIVQSRHDLLNSKWASVDYETLLELMFGYYDQMRFQGRTEYSVLGDILNMLEERPSGLWQSATVQALQELSTALTELEPRKLPPRPVVDPVLRHMARTKYLGQALGFHLFLSEDVGRLFYLSDDAYLIYRLCSQPTRFSDVCSRLNDFLPGTDRRFLLASASIALAKFHSQGLVEEIPSAR